jgi:hypothetical protein
VFKQICQSCAAAVYNNVWFHVKYTANITTATAANNDYNNNIALKAVILIRLAKWCTEYVINRQKSGHRNIYMYKDKVDNVKFESKH